MVALQNNRVVSGMRPTGKLHLGHYHGVLKNWAQMQLDYECFFFVADWHALTTHYDDVSQISHHVEEMVIDWLAAGLNPSSSTLFVQSLVPEHAELHLLLSMITPLGWLERVPTFKDQQEKLKEKDLATYGFLGYPLLQAADILLYKANLVPVGEDQVSHIELTREIARRFNFLFGREPDFEAKAETAASKMGKRNAKLYRQLRKLYQEQGDIEAIEKAQAMLKSQQNISLADRERLLGYLEGTGRTVLPEPEAALTETPKMPGIDGQKMSKSYGNTIALREEPESIEKKIRTMPTDTQRVRRSDPGDPDRCPVWQLHENYSNTEVKQWVRQGCQTASIGCLQCKEPIIDAIHKELKPIRERAQEYENDRVKVRQILREGSDFARDTARQTLDDVTTALQFDHHDF